VQLNGKKSLPSLKPLLTKPSMRAHRLAANSLFVRVPALCQGLRQQSTRISAVDAATEAKPLAAVAAEGELKQSAAYPFPEIEAKWQQYWEDNKTFRTPDDVDMSKPKYYVLDMFPYPRQVYGLPSSRCVAGCVAATIAQSRAFMHLGNDKDSYVASQWEVTSSLSPSF